MEPDGGQWWFPDHAESGESAEYRAIFVREKLNEKQWLIESSENYFGVWDKIQFDGWHHEPRCNGWDWVIPIS